MLLVSPLSNPIIASSSPKPSPPPPPSPLEPAAISIGRNERDQFAPSGGRGGRGWISLHNNVLYLIDSDEEVKPSVMRLVLHSGGCFAGWIVNGS